jgi:hypothetical protein
MTNRAVPITGVESPATRQLTCRHCGGHFDCALDGTCWCAHESVRLPMPAAGEDCLCPGCLRDAARAHGKAKTDI